MNKFHRLRSRRRRSGPRFAQSDENQAEIVSRLRLFPGVSVFETQDVGGGFPDLVVGFRNRTWLFEIKRPGHESELTPNELQFHQKWHGWLAIATSVDRILDAIGYPDYRMPITPESVKA